MRDGMYTDVRQVLEQVEHIILGKREEIREIMTAFLANGHVLLEDIPGGWKDHTCDGFFRGNAAGA